MGKTIYSSRGYQLLTVIPLRDDNIICMVLNGQVGMSRKRFITGNANNRGGYHGYCEKMRDLQIENCALFILISGAVSGVFGCRERRSLEQLNKKLRIKHFYCSGS